MTTGGHELFATQIAPHATSLGTATPSPAPIFQLLIALAVLLGLLAWCLLGVRNPNGVRNRDGQIGRRRDRIRCLLRLWLWQVRKPPELRGEWWARFERDFHSYVERSTHSRQQRTDKHHPQPPFWQ